MISIEKTSDSSRITGTSLTGYLEVSYQTLVELFGEPNANVDGYKTDAEWHLSVDTPGSPKRYVTVYNYKTGMNYCGKDGLYVEDIKHWHVGSRAKAEYLYLEEYITDHQLVQENV
jgi:hypothetical protein